MVLVYNFIPVLTLAHRVTRVSIKLGKLAQPFARSILKKSSLLFSFGRKKINGEVHRLNF